MSAYRTAAPQPERPEPKPFRRPHAAYVLFVWTVQLVLFVAVTLGGFLAHLELADRFGGSYEARMLARSIVCAVVAIPLVPYWLRRARQRRTELHPSPWFFW